MKLHPAFLIILITQREICFTAPRK